MKRSTKDIIDSPAEAKLSWFASFKKTLSNMLPQGIVIGQAAYGLARQIGWIVISSAMITVIPLMFELKREEMLEGLEQLQIKTMKQEGMTPSELAQQGITSAIEPKVF